MELTICLLFFGSPRSDEIKNDEMQLLLLPDTVPHDALCEEAQKIWKEYFGQARISCMTRLDKGIKRPHDENKCLAVTALQKKKAARVICLS